MKAALSASPEGEKYNDLLKERRGYSYGLTVSAVGSSEWSTAVAEKDIRISITLSITCPIILTWTADSADVHFTSHTNKPTGTFTFKALQSVPTSPSIEATC